MEHTQFSTATKKFVDVVKRGWGRIVKINISFLPMSLEVALLWNKDRPDSAHTSKDVAQLPVYTCISLYGSSIYCEHDEAVLVTYALEAGAYKLWPVCEQSTVISEAPINTDKNRRTLT